MSIAKIERLAFIQALRTKGIDLPDDTTVTEIAAAIEQTGGTKRPHGMGYARFVQAFLDNHGKVPYVGQIVPPRTPSAPKPLQISPQMRINMDRAAAHQPSLITPKGFGNGEGRFGFWPGY